MIFLKFFVYVFQTTIQTLTDEIQIPESNEPPRKRRRQGRKRKRRPHHKQITTQPQTESPVTEEIKWLNQNNDNQDIIIEQTMNYEEDNKKPTYLAEFRTEVPLITEEIRDPFTALEKERQLSEFREQQRNDPNEENYDKSYRRSYLRNKKQEMEEPPIVDSVSPALDLKNILKQTGGVSLSEILQQRNLSLDDLLRGKQVALAAISNPTPPIMQTEIPAVETNIDPKIPLPKYPSSDVNAKKRIKIFTPHIKEPTQMQPVFTEDPNGVDAEETNKIPPTIPNIRERFPSRAFDRIRQIKEVIPGIRPDLSNSNTKTEEMFSSEKKRLTPSTKNYQKPESQPVQEQSPTIRLPPRWKNLNRDNKLPATKFMTTTPFYQTEPSTNSDVTEIYREITFNVTDHPQQSSSSTINIPTSLKDLRNRLSLRPKLRLKPKEEQKKIEEIKITTTTEEDIQQFTEIVPEVHLNSQERESIEQQSIQEKIEKSKPAINIVTKFTSFGNEQDDVANAEEEKTKDVVAIEDLFEYTESNSNEMTSAYTSSVLQNTQPSLLLDYDESDVTEKNPSLFSDITSMRTVDDRTDLLELMEDRRSGARLAKVLAQRNMTLEELVEHRKRGSSQLHLAEIFNKSNEPSHADKMDIVTAFETFPTFNLGNVKSVNPDEIKTDSQGASYFTSIINIKPTDEVFKEDSIPKVDPYHVNTISQSTNWQTNSLTDIFEDDNIIPKVSASSSVIENSIEHKEDIVDIEDERDFKRNSVIVENASLPLGVRSAIFASSCIVVVSVIIFVIIFVVCRWRQKRRNKLNYVEENYPTKHGGGHNVPILHRDGSKRSTSPIVYPSPHCNKLNTMDPNSPEVQDYLYDAMRQPY